MCVCKYLNQRVRRIGEWNEESFKCVSKTKKKKKTRMISFKTQLKIEFLLPFTGRRKELQKMPGFIMKILPMEYVKLHEILEGPPLWGE